MEDGGVRWRRGESDGGGASQMEEGGVRWRRGESDGGGGPWQGLGGGGAYGSIPGRKVVPQPLFDPVTDRTSICCFGSESATESKHTTPSVGDTISNKHDRLQPAGNKQVIILF